MKKKTQANSAPESKRLPGEDYLFKSFDFTHFVLLFSCGLGVIILLWILIIVLTSPAERFFFDDRPIVYIFFGLVLFLLLAMIGVALIHVFSRDAMPTYDEYQRAKNLFAHKKKLSRFPELLDFDQAHPSDEKLASLPGVTLQSFCDDFHDYMADNLGLYYAIDDVRRFIASLAVSKIMILQGMSGTGKTSMAVAFGRFIEVPSTIVPVQPMWKERSDLLGYYNEFTGKFNETSILKKLYEANFSDRMFIIVLDEMNIARVEYYFSEFLSLLELPATSQRTLVVASSGNYGDPKKMAHGRIVLPDNVWFLGTANNDDSTFSISDKVYDRAMVMNLNNRAEPFKSGRGVKPIPMGMTQFTKLVEESRKSYSLSPLALAKIKDFDEYLIQTFHITFGNRIMMQMKKYVPAYMACGGTEMEAIDDIVAKKILRKLEAHNPVYVKNHAQEFLTKLSEIFGDDVMKSCQDYIETLARNL